MEIIRILLDFINDFWYKKHVYLYSVILLLAVYIVRLWNYNINSRKTWVEIALIAIGYVVLVGVIFIKRKIPHFSKKKKTIVFSIDAESENDVNVIKEKFVKDFDYSLLKKHDGYQVKTLNRFQTKKLNPKLLQDSDSVLKRYNVEFIIYGRCKKGNGDEEISCLLDLDGIVFKRKVEEEWREIIEREIRDVFIPLTNIKIHKKSASDDFKYNAEKLSLLMDYIIGTVFFMSKEYKLASDEYHNLRKNLFKYKKNDKLINVIKSVIGNRVYLASILVVNDELLEYGKSQNQTLLEMAKEYLDRISIENHDYKYHESYAIYDFLYNRNVKSATEHINKCSQYPQKTDWKFSRVFLNLYASNTITNLCAAYRTYKKLFEKNDFTVDFVNWILDFIYIVLDKEPEKNQLNFLIVLLQHFYYNDQQLKMKHFKMFSVNNSDKLENENFQKILSKLHLIDDYRPVAKNV